MAKESDSDRRQKAAEIFQEAQQEYEKGRLAWAVEHAREALRIDSSYHQLRHWLAQRYLEAGATARASRQYQLILRSDAEDEKAWAALEEIDPAGAERIKRLHEIPPDPFVSQRRAKAGDDFESLGEDATDDEEKAGAAPYLSRKQRSEQFETLNEFVTEQEIEEVGGVPFVTDREGTEEFEALETLTEQGEESSLRPPWEFEQDRQYWQQWRAIDSATAIIQHIEQVWSNEDVMERVLSDCAGLSARKHPEVVTAAEAAAQRLASELPQLYLIPERHMQPVVLRGEPASVGMTTGMIRTLSEAEMSFVWGRCLGWIVSGYVGELQAVELLIDRPIPIGREVAAVLRHVLAKATEELTADLDSRTQRKLKAIGHAWQQRAALSADRAGLLACRDRKVAASAIARSTATTADKAAKLTANSFMARYKGQDLQKLAAIPAEENPSSSPDYAAYRIQMLQWWAGTEEYEAARRQLDAD